MNKYDNWIGGAVLTALAVNIASNVVYKRWPDASVYSLYALLGVLSIWLVLKLIQLVRVLLLPVRFAVLVFFLNSENKLLLIRHPFHKRRIPPGGRLNLNELPHVAVEARLREEAGITSFEFHPVFQSVSRDFSV